MENELKTKLYVINMLRKGLGIYLDNGYYFQTSFNVDWTEVDNIKRLFKALEDSNYKFKFKVRGEGV